jgi:26S proteasome regulatory subunit T3
MAKAVANATTAAFITMVGSEFVQKYLGEGPRMVRDVFRLARENSPAIVFIDEIGKPLLFSGQELRRW